MGRSFEGSVPPTDAAGGSTTTCGGGSLTERPAALARVPPGGRAARSACESTASGCTGPAARIDDVLGTWAAGWGANTEATSGRRLRAPPWASLEAAWGAAATRARAISRAFGKRSSRFLRSARARKGPTGASAGSTRSMGSGSAVITAARRAYSVGAGKATRPVSIS